MIQKIIQVGNSLAVTIPKSFAQEVGWKAGKNVEVQEDREVGSILIQTQTVRSSASSLTPEFLSWLKKFNAKYKDVLTELAKR